MVLVRILAIVALLLASVAHAGQGWRVAGEPDWASQLPLRFDTRPMRGARDGRFYRIAERHHHYLGDAPVYYSRYAYQVINRRGLDGNTSVSVDFDPLNERVQLHKVVVHRDGVVIDQLGDGGRVRVLQREAQLDQGLYTGERTLDLILDDVRVGDWIEYSFSTIGRSSVFDGRVFGWSSLQSGVPVGDYLLRLHLPASANVATRSYGATLTPEETSENGVRQLTWHRENVPGFGYQSEVPAEYHGRALVQYSDFADWQALQSWAEPLFARAPGQTDSLISATADRFKSQHSDTHAQVAAAVTFVQDDIRYTGINSGIGAWIPDEPAEVLHRRYGDCKDKALLLSALLRELGVESQLALVHSSEGRALSGYLPSPSVFDHMILRVDLDGRQYWVDATRSLQGGRLDTLQQGGYHHALIPRADGTGLTAYALPQSEQPTKQVLETWRLADNAEDTPTLLTVRTTLRGWRAERMRERIQSGEIYDLEERYLEYYQGRYPGLESASQLQIDDNRLANELELVEQYSIDEGWYWDRELSDASHNRYSLDVKADAILEAASLPEDERRTQPLWVSHPTHVDYRIRIIADVDWDIETTVTREDNAWFFYSASAELKGGVIDLNYTYRSKTHRVAVSDARRYLRELEAIRDSSFYAVQVELPVTVDVFGHIKAGFSGLFEAWKSQQREQ